jgi:hypothetical protein
MPLARVPGQRFGAHTGPRDRRGLLCIRSPTRLRGMIG